MLNDWAGAGRLVRDPELRRTQNDKAVTNFTIAVGRDVKPKDGEAGVDYIDVVAWNQLAEFASNYLKKGKLVIVHGRLQIRQWKDDEDRTHIRPEIIADRIYFGESKTEESDKPKPTAEKASTSPEYSEIEEDDELPF